MNIIQKLSLIFLQDNHQYLNYVRSTLKMDLDTEIAKAEIEYICNVHRFKAKFESMQHLKGVKNEKPDD